MSRGFCPGHVSCVFQPFSSLDPMVAGSRGFGIRLSLGAHCTTAQRTDRDVVITIDGVECQAPVTRRVVELLADGHGFDIDIRNDLPVSQGFGMSAAGALSAALCICEDLGMSRRDAVMAAHVADVQGGGGLGDVAAIATGRDIAIRVLPGMPPHGKVESVRGRMGSMTLAVLGPKVVTGSVLTDPERMKRIRSAAEGCINAFMADRTVDSLYANSNLFSSSSGLESDDMRSALDALRSHGYHAGMCMLGNSIFTDAPVGRVRSLLGLEYDNVFSCHSCSDDLQVTRTV